MYKASQELIDILSANGFKNKSYLFTGDFGKKYSSAEPYDPGKHKREYGIGNGKRNLGFFFNYITLSVTERSQQLTEEYVSLDECKLRSIIAYFKCSYARRQSIRINCNFRIELAGQYMKEREREGLLRRPLDERFKELYSAVVLR